MKPIKEHSSLNRDEEERKQTAQWKNYNYQYHHVIDNMKRFHPTRLRSPLLQA